MKDITQAIKTGFLFGKPNVWLKNSQQIRNEMQLFVGLNATFFFGEEGRKLGVDAIPPQK